jgi:hypothetical protein
MIALGTNIPVIELIAILHVITIILLFWILRKI